MPLEEPRARRHPPVPLSTDARIALRRLRYTYADRSQKIEDLCASKAVFQIASDFIGKGGVDLAELEQAQQMHVNELGRPLPHVIARLQTKDSRHNRADGETVLR